MSEIIHFRKLHPEAQLPKRMTEGSLGLDIFAHLLTETGRPNNLMIPAHTTRPIGTGIAFTPASNFISFVPLHMICSRSGLAKQGIFVTNSPGIIDPDYEGELIVLLHNGSHLTYYVRHGDRIAQLITVQGRTVEAQFELQITPAPAQSTRRGPKGFGSTGR